MNERSKRASQELAALKNLMAQTDHTPNQLIEGLFSTLENATPLTAAAALVNYAQSALRESGETLRKRAAWRESIRALQTELSQAEEDSQEDAEDA